MTQPDVRHADGSLWMASYKSKATAMRALFDRDAPQFFFCEVRANPARRWWCWWLPRFVKTGATWEGSDMREAGFAVIRKKEANND